MTKLFTIFALVCLTMASASAQSTTDVKTEKITDTTGACAGIMSTVFPVACQSIKVSATSTDTAVIGFLFLMIYTDPLGTPHVVQQSSFSSESGRYSTSFPDFSVNYRIAALPLTGGSAVWVTP
jgi:hypothetical protein